MNDKPKLTDEQMNELFNIASETRNNGTDGLRECIKAAWRAAGFGETLIEQARRLRKEWFCGVRDANMAFVSYEAAYKEEHRLRLEAEKRNEAQT